MAKKWHYKYRVLYTLIEHFIFEKRTLYHIFLLTFLIFIFLELNFLKMEQN